MPKWFTPAAILCGLMFVVSPVLIARAPDESSMGMVYKIYYYHMPSAWMFLLAPLVCGISSALYLARGRPGDDRRAWAAAELTVLFGALTLITGPLWARRAWGTWWVWDARLTSELILLFLYLGYLALRSSFDDRDRADRASAVLAIVGVINVPIIHYSVEWWTTLHQPASVTRLAKPAIALPMLVPLFIMLAGYQLYFGWLLCRRLQGEILRRERSATWLAEVG